jgi:hypothetical protein
VVAVDRIGVGAGVDSRLRELQEPVEGVNVGERAYDSEHFLNRRAECFWALRQYFEAGAVDLDPADDILAAQLASLKYKLTSRGQIQVESKDDMRSRGLSSPDRADAVMLAFAAGQASLFDATSVVSFG